MPEIRRHTVLTRDAADPTAGGLELLEALPDAPSDRPPLLFVHGAWHGAWCWTEHWMPVAAERGWPAYAVSLTGHGGSDGDEALARIPLSRYARDVRAAMEEIGGAVVLVGHSMGGLLVQQVAADSPGVRAAALVAPVPPRHHLGAVGLLLRHDPAALARALVGAPPGFRPATLYGPATDPDTAARHTARTGRESLIATHQLVLPRRVRPLGCPTLVLGGAEDRLVSPHAVARTARTHGTRAHLYRGLGHNLMLEDDWRAPLETLLGWLEDTLG